MADAPKKDEITPIRSALAPPQCDIKEDQMVCERCGTEMYRMHAVWRCPGCGFKTDCCGW
jgi:rubrerythrin